jgi:hypothetical protein
LPVQPLPALKILQQHSFLRGVYSGNPLEIKRFTEELCIKNLALPHMNIQALCGNQAPMARFRH